MNKKDIINIAVLGFAIFSMLFGAGNVVFPPYLGFLARESWFIALIAFFMADVGLGILGFFAINNCSSPENVTNQIGKFYGTFLMATVMLCMGPLVVFPRTAATTFEMSIVPFFPDFSKILFSFIFCFLSFILCIKQSKVIDIVGKYLTPILLLGLTLLIIEGIINPALTKNLPSINNIVETAIKTGYQTLDVAGVLVFGAIISLGIKNKGYSDSKKASKILIYSSLLSALLLFLAYGGLCYLGAYASEDIISSISRADLLTTILQNLMGKPGLILFAVIVFMACITTAIAVLSSTAKYFSELTKGKISYRTFCAIISIYGAISANKGLETIVAFAGPILDFLYPPLLVLIFIAAIYPKLNKTAVYGSTIAATTISILNIINQYIYPIKFVNTLPMHNIGLDWIIPTVTVTIICILVTHKKEEVAK